MLCFLIALELDSWWWFCGDLVADVCGLWMFRLAIDYVCGYLWVGYALVCLIVLLFCLFLFGVLFVGVCYCFVFLVVCLVDLIGILLLLVGCGLVSALAGCLLDYLELWWLLVVIGLLVLFICVSDVAWIVFGWFVWFAVCLFVWLTICLFFAWWLMFWFWLYSVRLFAEADFGLFWFVSFRICVCFDVAFGSDLILY